MDEDKFAGIKIKNLDKRCTYIHPITNKPCRAWHMKNHAFCLNHSPLPKAIESREKKLIKSQSVHRMTFVDKAEGYKLPRFIELHNPRGIKKAYVNVIKACAIGGLDEKRMGALIYALNGYVGALEKLNSLSKAEGIGQDKLTEAEKDFMAKCLELNKLAIEPKGDKLT